MNTQYLKESIVVDRINGAFVASPMMSANRRISRRQTFYMKPEPAGQEVDKTSIWTSHQQILITEELETPNPHEYFQDLTYIYPINEDGLSFMNRYYGEKMRGMSNLPTARCGLFCNIVCSFMFIIFGLVFLGLANNVKELRMRYDDYCANQTMCVINFTLQYDFQAPLYLYYELDDYFSNHGFYVDSLQAKQIMGKDITVNEQNTFCVDAQLNSDMPNGNLLILDSGTGYLLDNGQAANPCGVAAKYIFNDSFVMTGPTVNTSIYLNQSMISSYYQQQKFQRHPLYQFRQWLDMNDELVVNWFSIQSLSQAMKLWARIDTNLYQGQYSIIVYNNYPTNIFNGKKSFILSTTSQFGTKNLLIGQLFIIISALNMTAFIYVYLREVRRQSNKTQSIQPYEKNEETPKPKKGHDISVSDLSNFKSMTKVEDKLNPHHKKD